MRELPFQTFERITEMKWTGGRSGIIVAFLRVFHIREMPGSAEANIELQEKLLALECLS